MTADRLHVLEELIVQNPEDPDLWFLLGKALLDAGRFPEAAAKLAEAARRNPDLAAIWRYWGEALQKAGDLDGALGVWRDGIAVAERTGELQAGKEMNVFSRRAAKNRSQG
ncbi:tetratricopeptide repeat protein [Candidatus Sumerlaeota bacterium]|nr:tetratricopeptide repeat protein [Candidatus Sumerlaeota bacterium]